MAVQLTRAPQTNLGLNYLFYSVDGAGNGAMPAGWLPIVATRCFVIPLVGGISHNFTPFQIYLSDMKAIWKETHFLGLRLIAKITYIHSMAVLLFVFKCCAYLTTHTPIFIG